MSDPPPPAAPRGHVRAAVACLVVGLALAHRPLFRGQVVGMRDMTRWVHPAQWRVRDALAHAHLPRWNALEGLGFPTLADPLYAVFYPPMLLTHVLAPLVAITVVWWLHLVLAAVGMFTLARRDGRTIEAATLAGFAYSLSGPLASEWTLGMRLPGYGWLPWMAVGAWDLVVRRDRSAAALARAAVPVGLALLAGEAFVVFFAVGVATVIALAAAPARPWRALARWVGAVALAGLLAAPALLPPIALAATTQRAAALSPAELDQWSLAPARALDLVVRGGLGLAALTRPTPALARLVDGTPFLESLYVGVLTVGLAAFALRRRRYELALAGLVALALLAAMGRHTPVLAALRALLPPLRLTRSPEKLLLALTAPLALLAAAGLDRLSDRPFARRAAWVLAACALAEVALFAWAVRWAPVELRVVFAVAARDAVVVFALAAAALRWSPSPAFAGRALAVLVLADLGLNAAHFDRWIDPAAATTAPATLGLLRRSVAPRAPGVPIRLWRSPEEAGARPMRWFVETYVVNTGAVFGVAEVHGYDVAIPRALTAVLASRRTDVLRSLAVDAAVTARGGARPGLRLLADAGGGATLYTVERPLPRAYLADRVRLADDATARARLVAGDLLDGRTVFVRPDADVIAREDVPVEGPGGCAITRYDDGELDARCDATRAAVAVFVEQYAPGWRVTVDGREGRVLAVNGLMRGVALTPGAHRLALRYETPWLRASLGLWAVGWGAVAAMLVASRLRRRATQGPDGVKG